MRSFVDWKEWILFCNNNQWPLKATNGNTHTQKKTKKIIGQNGGISSLDFIGMNLNLDNNTREMSASKLVRRKWKKESKT